MKGDVKYNPLPPRRREHLGMRAIQTLVITGTLPILQQASDSLASFARPLAIRGRRMNPRSYRDLLSTFATLPTTVLSETLMPIALFGHARGPIVSLETRYCRTDHPLRLTLDLASRRNIDLDSAADLLQQGPRRIMPRA
jgi:hypothetical protein